MSASHDRLLLFITCPSESIHYIVYQGKLEGGGGGNLSRCRYDYFEQFTIVSVVIMIVSGLMLFWGINKECLLHDTDIQNISL